jgi:hypothetical protein
MYMITPASIDPAQRGHFWPLATLARLPSVRTETSTVWVQMGQYTFAIVVRISIGLFTIWFMAFSLQTD